MHQAAAWLKAGLDIEVSVRLVSDLGQGQADEAGLESCVYWSKVMSGNERSCVSSCKDTYE